jgi:hypothetical protein
MQAEPFRPFRIRLIDGRHHDIVRGDMAFVTTSFLDVGVNLDLDGFAEYAVRCAIVQIKEIEDLPRTPPGKVELSSPPPP